MVRKNLSKIRIYANSHYVTPNPTLNEAIKNIKKDLKEQLNIFDKEKKCLEYQRLEQRTNFDLEMLKVSGSCAGIENYSRYLTGRKAGHAPPTLMEYMPNNSLIFTSES